MDDEERDNLLIRMDERLKGLKEGDIPEIKTHLEKVNNIVGKHEKRITRNEVILYCLGAGTIGGGGIAKLLGLF